MYHLFYVLILFTIYNFSRDLCLLRPFLSTPHIHPRDLSVYKFILLVPSGLCNYALVYRIFYSLVRETTRPVSHRTPFNVLYECESRHASSQSIHFQYNSCDHVTLVRRRKWKTIERKGQRGKGR